MRVSSAAVTSPLPVSARLAWWGTAWLRGQVSPDDLLDAVLDGDVAHLVTGEPLLTALAGLRAAGATAFGAAFPREGAPVGLGGPADFNAAAIEHGEALVAVGAEPGLGPAPGGADGRVDGVPGCASAGAGRRRGRPRAAGHPARCHATQLADLDVAQWRPEVADELMDLRHRRIPAAPPGVPARCAELAARGLQALGIADLALADDGGALSADQSPSSGAPRSPPLDLAGRRALVAACSPEAWPPG